MSEFWGRLFAQKRPFFNIDQQPFHTLVVRMQEFVGFPPVHTVLIWLLMALAIGGYGWLKRKPLTPPAKTVVLIAHFDRILGAGIESLLQSETAFEWRNLYPINVESLRHAIYEHQPDVVVVAGYVTHVEMNDLFRVTDQLSELRMVCVGVNDQIVHILDTRNFLLHESSDLARILREGSLPTVHDVV